MPTTRKKIIKTVFKDEESEGETGDFSDSGSEAKISEASSSEDDIIDDEDEVSSGDDFRSKTMKKFLKVNKPPIRRRKPKFAKDLVTKINKQINAEDEDDLPASQFTVKDLTDADKLLPSFLNLSESDSSDDESHTKSTKKKAATTLTSIQEQHFDNDSDDNIEYRDVWSSSIQDNSADIAKKTFMELEKHKTEIEQTKASIENYVSKNQITQNVSKNSVDDFNVNDLLAQGEEVVEEIIPVKKGKARRRKDDSDSEVEDWEEVNEAKSIPQQGLQLFVEFPNAVKKSKKLDVEMMMKRKINRVKKEYQVYMHQVHVLCWLAHGNYVSQVLNDQDIMSAALAMVPKGCYPEERLTTKYVEEITTWFKDKLTLKQDKHENKFRPKAPPLKNILLSQIKSRVTTAKKYNIFIFVAMLRALGLQCRVMFNFVTVPIRPPSSELCSLSLKSKDDTNKAAEKAKENASEKSAEKNKAKPTTKSKAKCPRKIGQVDGIDDSFSESENDCFNIMQLDGSDDTQVKPRKTRSTRAKKSETDPERDEDEGVSPPKRVKTNDKQVLDQNKSKEKITTITDNKAKTTKNKSGNSSNKPKSNKPPVAPRSALGNKDNESQKNSDAADITGHDNISTIQNGPKTRLKRTARNINLTSNTANDYTKQETSNTHNAKSPKQESLRKSQSNVESGENLNDEIINRPLDAPKSTSGVSVRKQAAALQNEKSKRKTSKSPQPRNNKSEETNKQTKTNTNNGDTLVSINTSKKSIDDSAKPKLNGDSNPRKTRSERRNQAIHSNTESASKEKAAKNKPIIIVTDENVKIVESQFFSEDTKQTQRRNLNRKRSHTTIVNADQNTNEGKNTKPKARTKSAPGTSTERSKYFENEEVPGKKSKLTQNKLTKKEQIQEEKLRVSHRDLRQKAKPKNDVTEDLVDIIKGRIKHEKAESKKGIVKGKVKDESDDSDFLPVEDAIILNDSDEEFKPTKISPRPLKISSKPSTSKKLDRRVLSSDDDVLKPNKLDVWCEVFVEELEQWIAVDVIKGKVHCSSDLYTHATHPVCYIVGWDNNNYLKDLTRRYVPHWNTVTRKQRAGPIWWKTAIQPWLGPKTARDREEDEYLDRMQLEAPLPKSIAEYKNHPLYALKRHLLKFEALYPPDAATLGFVRGEPVYSRDCVYTCQSRDKWLKEAKVVRLGEQPYKVVKARPKWDKLSNKCITDKPLEIFGPWQVQDYEPPTAENGIVPRNAYGNVELFKQCMLPKKTVHIKLPGLNKVAKKLSVDCAPAMTGFDFNGGFSHPVYDGFVVCEEFEEIITDAWVKDQEEQERKEREKIDLRVYGNWKRLIRGLMIRERLKLKYGFEEPSTSQAKPKSKGPRLVVKKK